MTCRCHCSACGAHFSGLEAFDTHRSGPASNRECSFPDDGSLLERTGTCRISAFDSTGQPICQEGVTVYQSKRALRASCYFAARAGAKPSADTAHTRPARAKLAALPERRAASSRRAA
jgi:hypothetical protein